MTVSRNWEPPIRRMERLLRLKSFPIAFKLLEDKADLAGIPFLRRLGHRSTLCQLLNIVRSFDWTVGADESDLMAPMCSSIIGLNDIPELMRDGTFRSIVWTKTKKDGEKYENAIPRIPTGRYEAVVMAPLVYNPFDPDIVLVYANPAQMILLINALQFEDYEVMQFYCVGESSCSDAIARCYLTQKPSLTIPCYGERRYGHTQDDEIVMALPASMVDKAVAGLEVLYKRGVRYPISYAGAESDISPTFPGAYLNSPTLAAAAPENKRHLLLGVTGGIATGKTTVSRMLEELGAPLIDFDVLARDVVEPGKPAYEDIVAFFGRQVLAEDGTLNRKRLGEIVFSDLEKRKKLEGFTHPRIGEAFLRLIGEHTREQPEAVIQVAVPLLIEQNMNHLFDKLVLVYTPEEIQRRRLIDRDGISPDAAQAMVASQLSIEDKKGYVDFIIDNTGTPEETRRQVQELWETLLALPRGNAGQKGGTDGK
jgi:dephospho-CoA kinase